MFKQLTVQAFGFLAGAARRSGLTKDEKIVVGGLKYPADEFLGYSDQKIADILRQAGGTEEQVRLSFKSLEAMGRTPRSGE
jgi:hypothetical protein